MYMSSLEQKVQAFKQQYYSKETKSLFSSSASKKFKCAQEVTNEFNLQELMCDSISIVRDTCKIYVDYPKVKCFVNPNNYDAIRQHVFTLSESILRTHPSFELHINLQTFTVTAAQRYKDLITLFCNQYLNASAESEKLSLLYIYNTPKMVQVIQNMFSPFISQSHKNKIILLKPEHEE